MSSRQTHTHTHTHTHTRSLIFIFCKTLAFIHTPLQALPYEAWKQSLEHDALFTGLSQEKTLTLSAFDLELHTMANVSIIFVHREEREV